MKKKKTFKKNLEPRSIPASEPMKPQKNNRKRVSDREFRSMENFPQYFGEETQGGKMPNPEADDDTLENVQQWGQGLDTNGEHPKEINPVKDIAKAEKARRQRRE